MSVVPLTLRETNFRASKSRVKKYNVKQAVSNELSHILFSCKHNRVFTGDREPSREPEPTLNCLRNKTRKLKEFVHQRIRLSIGCVKVRKVSKMFVSLIQRR